MQATGTRLSPVAAGVRCAAVIFTASYFTVRLPAHATNKARWSSPQRIALSFHSAESSYPLLSRTRCGGRSWPLRSPRRAGGSTDSEKEGRRDPQSNPTIWPQGSPRYSGHPLAVHPSSTGVIQEVLLLHPLGPMRTHKRPHAFRRRRRFSSVRTAMIKWQSMPLAQSLLPRPDPLHG
jgi:hypothetical protein